jgi:hypothetical protein
MFLASGRYRVERGEVADVFDTDASVAPTTVARGLPAAVTEQGQNVFNRASGLPEVVRSVTGRFRHGTDLVAGDRVIDEVTNDRFVVIEVHTTASGINRPDVVAALTRNTAGG